ncbi:hypothetical protein A1Q2_08400 [Trichosporon asahii var. asahii CBS 8904]|uniref:ABM domain-containing protein n=2 Tax=Trichosporon asahii var. asahii TaxID=189963 RepID=K1V9B9_TRIAC|nr:hypothetical protein A1Q1_01194 [Trichosporon asahii var. asahii CBS 2479]EJT49696.1 hypothetical protein A1Q1_01194 [Trichosporon asahii var. asahii CBS 2479]EKC97320.1 hypothetical protein A1Q2_08400 [Trichosporon asahii var. asahii CBS 8904]
MGITIIAKFTPKPGKENELRDALAEAAPIYRKDPGTLGWHVLSGKKDAKGSFVAVERYENAQAIQTHAANPVFGKKVHPLCAKQTELTFYDEIEDKAKL